VGGGGHSERVEVSPCLSFSPDSTSFWWTVALTCALFGRSGGDSQAKECMRRDVLGHVLPLGSLGKMKRNAIFFLPNNGVVPGEGEN